MVFRVILIKLIGLFIGNRYLKYSLIILIVLQDLKYVLSEYAYKVEL